MCPCCSPGNASTTVQATWLETGSPLLPRCPHCGQLSQQPCGTQGTWLIATFPAASEGLQRGPVPLPTLGRRHLPWLMSLCRFCKVGLCPCVSRGWCQPSAAPIPAPPARWRGGLGLRRPGGTRGEAAATNRGDPWATAALEGKAGPGAMPGMPTPPWGKRDRAGLSGPPTAPSLGICPSWSLQKP